MKYLLLTLITACLFSCVTQNNCAKKFPCQGSTVYQTDTFTREVEKEKIVTVPGETVVIKTTVNCDKNGKAQLKSVTKKNGKASIKTQITDGVFQVDCICDSSNIALQWKEKHTTIKTNKETTVVKDSNAKTGWEKFKSGLSDLGLYIVIFLLGAVLGFLISFLKFFGR